MNIGKIDKTILDDYERLREIVKCAILHSEGLAHKQIADRLGISPPTVTRYIKKARERGIIRVEVHPPPEVGAAEKIEEVYGLREAHVFPIGIAEGITDMLGGLSAAYLDRCLDDGSEEVSRIAIGPGRTILAFVSALSDRERPEMMVGSTTSATDIETYIASNILIGIPAGKWKCGLRRFDPKMSLEEQRDYADVFVFGIGKVPDMKGVTVLALLSQRHQYDIDELELEREFLNLAIRGGAGIINYQPIDEEGDPLDWDIEIYNKVFGPTVLKLDVIKEVARDEEKKVICIAGGGDKDKVKAVRAGLRGGYFNVLMTDYETAAALLERQNE
jgi:DNA-binding transcriptional regulator LsrR (DeoR family)